MQQTQQDLDTTDQRQNSAIRDRLVSQLYQQGRSAVIAMPTTALLLVIALNEQMNNTVLLGWLLSVFAVTLARSSVMYRYSISEEQQHPKWLNFYIAIELASGITWGITGYALSHLGDLYQLPVYLALGGMLLGSSVMLAPAPGTFYAFCLSSIAVFNIYLFGLDSPIHIEIMTLTVVFAAVLLVSINIIHNQIKLNLTLGVQNATLLQDLTQINDALVHKIHEQEDIQRELEKSQSDLTHIIDNLQETFYRTDKNGKLIRISPSVYKLLGFKPEELLGTNLAGLYKNSEQRAEFIALLQKNGGVINNFEAPLVHKNNEVIWVSTSARYITDEQGEYQGIEGITRDISKNKIAADALLKTKEEFKKLFEFNRELLAHAPVGILTLDAGNKATYMNPTLSRLLGVPDGEQHIAIGKDFASFPSIKGTELVDLLNNIVKGKNIHTEIDLASIYGKYLRLEVSGISLQEHNRYAGCVIFCFDITDRKKYQDNLKLAKERAELITQTRNELFFSLSRNLRIPLNDIMGTTELLLKQNSDSLPLSTDLSTIQQAAQRLLEYVKSFIEMEEGSQSNYDNLLLNEFIETLKKEFKNTLDPSRIRFIISENIVIDHGLYSDFNIIRRILDVLLGNISHQMATGSVNLVFEIEKRNQLHIILSDNGPSIDVHKANAVFSYSDAFNLDTSFEKKHFHLFVVRQLVNTLKGRLWAEQVSERQVAIHITLPVYSIKQTQKQTQVETKPLNILIVDDNEGNQKVITRMLTHMKHTTDTAENGEQALEKVLQNNYDLILMDLNMPVMSGMESSRAIRMIDDPAKANIPIIAMTANVMEKENYHWQDAGMDNFMEKPLSMDKLRLMLEKHSSPA